MTQEHPIAPPPELVDRLQDLGNLDAIELAFQAGADQELEACCEWLKAKEWIHHEFSDELRAARRPKPPSLKEQALAALSRADKDALTNPLTGEVVALRTILSKEQSNTIRRALERLQELESNG